MGNQRLEPISAIEDPPDPPEGFGAWSEYTDPGGRWLPKAAKAGAFTATTVVSGFLFAFALGAVPGLDMISFGAVTPATALIAGLAVLVSLVGVHEGLHGVVGHFIGADVSFTSGRYGSFRTLSRHAIQGRRETIAFYLAPLIIGTPLWFGVLLAAGMLEAPHALLVANIALAANVGGSALDFYHAWGIANLPKDSVVYNTRYRMLVAVPLNVPNNAIATSE
ncbi:DUF3267 domain-containing protein [Halococcus sp. IIIV-5B]|uniref:DUF3267 domain-containing protein n=1 Tax=Halococcus sp. IIIV-5B TaxID=2321230 RepID=UPI001314F61C|nr:DUF3267 domain-containing protein [Halococcus sp. IIIV-5B]